MSIRPDVLTVLHDIASRDRHYEWYVATAGEGNVASELWRHWVRHGYLPQSAEFQREFSQEEQDRLELFTQFFEARLKELPLRFESLMVNVQWEGIRHYAEEVMRQLSLDDPDA